MPSRRAWYRCAFPALALLVAAPLPASSDVIADWNATAETIGVEKRLLPPVFAHNMALLHVAMFEAANAVDRRYAPYRLALEAEDGTSDDAAAAVAAHVVLTTTYPDQQAALDAALDSSLAGIADEAAKAKGVGLGRRAAAEVLALRAGDGSLAPESYRPFTAPGVYVPTPVPVSSTYGGMMPWIMAAGSQFRPGAPPALDSATWTADLNEIRELGSRHSVVRTEEQTEIGRFWLFTGPSCWNPVVRQLTVARKLDTVDSARLFALVAMAADDAFIAVFDAKYAHNFWRPVTAIRNADLTGNAATPRDASWLPIAETPMHPEYPCAHCITSSAVGAVLRSELGDDVPEFSMNSPTAPGITRRWTRIRDYTDEISMARIYAGVHYRFSTTVGEEIGREIGELAVATQLRDAGSAALVAKP